MSGGMSSGSMAMLAASMATTLATTIASSNAQAAQGKAAEQEAQYESTQNLQNANNAAASGERAMISQNKNTALVQSNLVAGAAGSGGTSTDVSTLNDESVIKSEGDFRAANALYEGNAKAQAFRNQAAGDIYQGNLTNQAQQIKSQTTLMNGASSLFTKYGGAMGSGLDAAGNAINTQAAYGLNNMGYGNTAYDMLDGTN